jgi:hypothetical protein
MFQISDEVSSYPNLASCASSTAESISLPPRLASQLDKLGQQLTSMKLGIMTIEIKCAEIRKEGQDQSKNETESNERVRKQKLQTDPENSPPTPNVSVSGLFIIITITTITSNKDSN